MREDMTMVLNRPRYESATKPPRRGKSDETPTHVLTFLAAVVMGSFRTLVRYVIRFPAKPWYANLSANSTTNHRKENKIRKENKHSITNMVWNGVEEGKKMGVGENWLNSHMMKIAACQPPFVGEGVISWMRGLLLLLLLLSAIIGLGSWKCWMFWGKNIKFWSGFIEWFGGYIGMILRLASTTFVLCSVFVDVSEAALEIGIVQRIYLGNALVRFLSLHSPRRSDR